MTEREKVMQDMEKVAFPIYKPNSKEIMILGALYDAGYRKADEVRKEIFDKLTETFMEMTAYGSDSNQHIGYYDYSIKVGYVVEIIAEVLGFEYKDYEEHTNRYDFRNWLKEKFGIEVEE